MLTGFHHTGIVVRNLELCVQFYAEVLGLKVLAELDSIAPPEGNHTGIPGARRKLVFLGFESEGSTSGHQIELVHYIDPPAADTPIDKHQLGAMHVCFEVADLEEAYQQLVRKGVSFATEPKYSISSPGPADSGASVKVGVIYGQDPEGNWFELIQWNVAN
jgi:catechol 2,3-dioxygenase-like lactoylglutathione lyase family enzyme